jgi:hypothetical protein
MQQANDSQVGGSHYQAKDGFQHWDLMILLNMPYTIGCATKYLYRWRDKNGIEDLKKAKHYLEKTLEMYSTINAWQGSRPLPIADGHIPSTVGAVERMLCMMALNAFNPHLVVINGLPATSGEQVLTEAIAVLGMYITQEQGNDVYAPAARAAFAAAHPDASDQPKASELHPG